MALYQLFQFLLIAAAAALPFVILYLIILYGTRNAINASELYREIENNRTQLLKIRETLERLEQRLQNMQ